MVRIQDISGGFPAPGPKRLLDPNAPRLIAKCEIVLDTINAKPAYPLQPEILGLFGAEMHPTYRLILDLMWTTGAWICEVLALRPSNCIDDGYDFMVVLRTLKQRLGPPTKVQLARSPKRAVPIVAPLLIDRI